MECLRIIFPHLELVQLDRILVVGESVVIQARTTGTRARCPVCRRVSARVHSRYVRRLSEAAIAAKPACLVVRVRKFFCENPSCRRRTFAEPLAFAERYARRTELAQASMTSMGLALGGRPGARLAAALGIGTSRSSLLRLVRRVPDPVVTLPRVLGVDDFATRRGYKYGTILVDMVTRRPIDVLPDRTAETFAQWLREHPGVQIICRDRDGAYAKGARDGAPQAVQVADRFHLWANLGEAVEKTVIAHRACLAERDVEPTDVLAAIEAQHSTQHEVEPLPDADTNVGAEPYRDGFRDVCGQPRRLVQRHTERFDAVQGLRAQGMSIRAIMRALQLDRKTVRRFIDAASLDELLFKATHRVSKLDAFKPYLNHRVSEGATNAAALMTELHGLGYKGSEQTVRRYLRPLRAKVLPKSKARRAKTYAGPPAPRKPRRVAAWIMTDPANLKAGHALQLKRILARCPELEALAGHVTAFAAMMRDLRGDRLGQWMANAAADDLPALHSMLAGLRRDLDAVTAGLTLPWNSGLVEGHVNRIKMLKRQMFGRANFDLLRKRILLTP